MNPASSDAVIATLSVLEELTPRGALPKEVESALGPVRAKYPDTRIDLLFREERYDGTWHYDALIGVGQATVSLSYCPDRALPWPLRGIQRWNDRDLARVNGEAIEVMDAMRLIDFVWDEQRIAERLLNVCLLRSELETNPVSVSREELQEAVDAFRRSRGLLTVDQTQAWMKQMGFDHARLERVARERVELIKLRQRLTESQVADFFERHRSELDVARIAVIELGDATQAREVALAAKRGDTSFLELAERCFSRGESSGNLLRRIRRRDDEALGRAIFAGSTGDIVGPVPTAQRYAVVKILELVPASLDLETRQLVQHLLFDRWLEDRRRSANVEWYWGKDRSGA